MASQTENQPSFKEEWNHIRVEQLSEINTSHTSSHGGVWEIIIGFEVVWDCGFGARKWRQCFRASPVFLEAVKEPCKLKKYLVLLFS